MRSQDAVEAQNVLIAAPAMSDRRKETCYDHLSELPPEGTDLLRVTYRDTPERLIEEWTSEVGGQPARTVVVSVNDHAPSGLSDGSVPSGGQETRVEVLGANPNDLTGLGMTLNTALTELGKTENGLVVCFDSVSALLQFADVESAYKFLHMFTNQLRTAGAHAHFHVDPEAHDTQTVSRIKTAFDDLVEVTD